MRVLTLIALAAGAAVAQPAMAGTFSLSLTADNGSRWYDYQSGVYTQLGSSHNGTANDGYYLITNNAAVGGGIDSFAHDNDFSNIGTLTYDDTTLAITGLTLNFSPYVMNGTGAAIPTVISQVGAITNKAYSTALSNVTGSVTLVNGQVSTIDLESTITFSWRNASGSVTLPYTGTFAIDGDTFALNVDSTNRVSVYDLRYVWDVDGSVQGLAAAVPEPSTYAMMGLGILALGAVARRRARG